jgi:hypothetical protein
MAAESMSTIASRIHWIRYAQKVEDSWVRARIE